MSEIIAAKQSTTKQKYNEEWLKTFKGFDSYSEEESKKTIKQLEMLADVICQHFVNTS